MRSSRNFDSLPGTALDHDAERVIQAEPAPRGWVSFDSFEIHARKQNQFHENSPNTNRHPILQFHWIDSVFYFMDSAPNGNKCDKRCHERNVVHCTIRFYNKGANGS